MKEEYEALHFGNIRYRDINLADIREVIIINKLSIE